MAFDSDFRFSCDSWSCFIEILKIRKLEGDECSQIFFEEGVS